MNEVTGKDGARLMDKKTPWADCPMTTLGVHVELRTHSPPFGPVRTIGVTIDVLGGTIERRGIVMDRDSRRNDFVTFTWVNPKHDACVTNEITKIDIDVCLRPDPMMKEIEFMKFEPRVCYLDRFGEQRVLHFGSMEKTTSPGCQKFDLKWDITISVAALDRYPDGKQTLYVKCKNCKWFDIPGDHRCTHVHTATGHPKKDDDSQVPKPTNQKEKEGVDVPKLNKKSEREIVLGHMDILVTAAATAKDGVSIQSFDAIYSNLLNRLKTL